MFRGWPQTPPVPCSLHPLPHSTPPSISPHPSVSMKGPRSLLRMAAHRAKYALFLKSRPGWKENPSEAITKPAGVREPAPLLIKSYTRAAQYLEEALQPSHERTP